MKYRKKPVVIEAYQWTGEPNGHWPNWLLNHERQPFISPLTSQMLIETLEGQMAANLNDWIIQGVKGEIYPCKPDIFEAIYELAE